MKPDDAALKLGLALSGGGFRAAFFHLGVLSQLAKAGVLPRISILSTVSGGSIIGAYYVLRLQREIEQAGYGSLGPDAYVELMRKVEVEFAEGVKANMRTRTFADFVSNVKMVAPTYSRSDRLGELLDRYFFLRAKEGRVGGKGEKVEIAELPEPRTGVPELVINATTLNTGHAWRFERESMGESWPDSAVAWDIDRSDTYFRASGYAAMVEKRSHFSIGKAVAASAAVPGLFHPLAVSDLYENRLQLVDGGVFDNQGVDALIRHGCTHVIVSDAGGQMGAIEVAPTAFLGVALRSSSIQYGRVRQACLERLAKHLPLERLTIVHALKGVPARTHPWRNERGDFEDDVEDEQERPPEIAPMRVEVQKLLAGVRTDLDAFNDVEANALMLSGYLLAEREVATGAGELAQIGTQPDASRPFAFERIRLWIDPPSDRFGKLLGAARSRFGKLLRIRPLLAIPAGILAYLPIAVVVAALSFVAWRFGIRLLRAIPGVGDAVDYLADLFRTRPFAWALVSLLAGLALSYGFARYVSVVNRIPGETRRVARMAGSVRSLVNATTMVTRALVAVLAFFAAWPSIRLIDPLYLRAGRIEGPTPPDVSGVGDPIG
jgi:NTE family protein